MDVIICSHLKGLKEEYKMKKLKHLQKKELRFRQSYMSVSSLEDARLESKFRTNMLDNRANMGKKYQGKSCPHCPAGRQNGEIETTLHWFECEAYLPLRQGADPEMVLEDRVKFLRRVLLLRPELEKHLP